MFNRRKPINVDGRQLAWQFDGEPGASFDVSDAAAAAVGQAHNELKHGKKSILAGLKSTF